MFSNNPIVFSIDSGKTDATFQLSNKLYSLLPNYINLDDIVVLCVGTDRSTGDCLGPLVGEKLNKNYLFKNSQVFGTLREPVHAKNLDETINNIYKNFRNPFIIAIDASLGRNENIGKINVINGPLFPGAGVNKKLQPVGDLSITGIVNISGFMEYVVLQNTRLSTVMQIADVISLGLYIGLKNFLRNNSASAN